MTSRRSCRGQALLPVAQGSRAALQPERRSGQKERCARDRPQMAFDDTGWIGGDGSISGASAVVIRSGGRETRSGGRETRSGGKVTSTSVPIRSFDLNVKVPPWRSTKLLAIGNPKPAPCSADLIEFDPCPKEASTIGISSSGIPEPESFMLIYCPPDAVHPTLSQISPPGGVNLIAFPKRLRQIWRMARSSAHKGGRSGSNNSWTTRRRLLARMPSRWLHSATTVARDTTASLSSYRPASMRDRSRISLIRPKRCTPDTWISLE